jgi:hypothetical protein
MIEPHQRRVLDEKQELDLRLARLTAFATSESFAKVPLQERTLLLRQLELMLDLSHVLGQRITLWGSPLAAAPDA